MKGCEAQDSYRYTTNATNEHRQRGPPEYCFVLAATLNFRLHFRQCKLPKLGNWPLLVEKFKRDRRESITNRDTVRSPASVNHELTLLSKIFSLAIDYKVTDTNPCTKVRKYRLDNKSCPQIATRQSGQSPWPL